MLYALAPKGLGQNEANRALNDFIAEPRRGRVVQHDHFVDRAGGWAVFDIESAEQLAALQEPGPLAGWEIWIDPLAFSDSARGFIEQIKFTLEYYAKTSLEEIMHEAPGASPGGPGNPKAHQGQTSKRNRTRDSLVGEVP